MLTRSRSSAPLGAAIAAALLSMSAPTRAQTCGTWEVVPNPILDGAETIPIMLAPFSSESAIGLRNVNLTGQLSVAHMAWDGTAWSVAGVEPIPDLEGGTGWEMRGLFGSAPDDLWGVGIAGLDNFHGAPFLAHFDGQVWTAEISSLFDDPNPEAGDPVRTAEGADVIFIGPDDIWVVGTGDNLEKTVSSPVVCHWDGSALDEFQPLTPVYGRINQCQAGAGVSSGDAWLVGYGRNTGESFHLFTHHWDGSSWTAVTSWTPLPGQVLYQDMLEDVVALAADDVWAVGKKLILVDGTTHSASLYLHWDGSGWTEIDGPDIGPLNSVTAAAADDIWVSVAFGEYGGRVAHYDGTTWTDMSTATIAGATHIALARVAASPAGDVWAIGSWGIYDGAGGWDVYENLIEHFTTGCPGDPNGDGVVDVTDLLAVLSAWGLCTGCPEDVNGDGTVSVIDLLVVLANWS